VKRRVVVGVDGGGTKTLAQATEVDGGWQGRGMAGPSNPYAVGFEAACTEITAAISEALNGSELAALCLGLSGAGRPEDVEQFTVWARGRFPSVPLKVVNDAEILLAAGASTGPALALVCGTGSILFGRAADGRLIRAGGWGYLFGDEGSGFAIGVSALRVVMQAFDGRGAPTLLTELILAQRGVESPPGLVPSIYGAESPRTEIAGLAELVEQAAVRGDALALSILNEAAFELAESVRAVYRSLGSVPLPLILSGGVILHGKVLAQAFRRACNTLGLVFTEMIEVPEPVAGAVMLARQLVMPF
jgi:N-acetylglucosamine kinase-like BadF-type ATPase